MAAHPSERQDNRKGRELRQFAIAEEPAQERILEPPAIHLAGDAGEFPQRLQVGDGTQPAEPGLGAAAGQFGKLEAHELPHGVG